jgi:phage-related protein
MAIVGTAFVRLRVIGDTLKKDITTATEKAVKESAPNLRTSGEDVGKKISEGAGKEFESSVGNEFRRIADRVGTDIGTRMAENMSRSLGARSVNALLNVFQDPKPTIKRYGTQLKGQWDSLSKDFEKNVSKKMEGALKNGLFSAFSLAAVAAPSMLAWAGAVAGALGSTLITAMAALGPAVAGGGLAIGAAFATMKLNAGLIGLALKAQTPMLDDFKKRTEAFKNTIATPIQVGLLSGFNAAMRISQPLVAALTPMLKELGNNVGDIAINMAAWLREEPQLERLQRIFTVNNDIVKQVGAGIVGLGQAFVVLYDHLGGVLLFLADGVKALGDWAFESIAAAEASGQLSAFVDRSFNATRALVGVLVDFAFGIINVFKAAFGASGGMIDNLASVARNFRAWTGDQANQDRMTAFFERMRIITGEVVSLMGDLARVAGHALEGTNVDSVVAGFDRLRSLGPPIAEIFKSIQENAGGALAGMFQNLADVVNKLAESGVLGQMANAFSLLFEVISKLLDIPGVGQLLAFVVGLAALAKVAGFVTGLLKPLAGVIETIGPLFKGVEKGTGALQIIMKALGFVLKSVLLPALEGIVAILGWPVTLILAITAALIWFFTQTEIGRKAWAVIWNAIKIAFQVTVDAIVAGFHWVVNALGVAWDFVKGAAQGIWSAISTAFNAVRDVVSTVFSAVWNVITTIWGAIWGFLEPIIQGIWNVIQTVFGGIVSFIEGVLNVLYQIWIRVWPILALPIRILYGVIIFIFQALWGFIQPIIETIVGWVVGRWNDMVNGVTAFLQLLWIGIQNIWNAVWGFIQTVVGAIVDWVVGRWNDLVSGVTAYLQLLWIGLQNIWNAIWGFIQPIIQAIVGFVVDRWNNLVANVSAAMSWIWGIITGIWNSVVGFLQGAMNRIGGIIGGVWDFLGGVGRAALDGIKAAVNVVIDAVNTVIHGLNWAIDLANKLPGPDIPRIPDIPRLARGGTVAAVNGGTLALLGEAGRSERVEPLDPSGLSDRDRALIKELSGGGQGTEVHVYLGTRELTELVDYVVEDRTSGIADRVLTGTKG